MPSDLHRIPDPCPRDAVLIGPPAWAEPGFLDSMGCVGFTDPEAAWQWLQQENDPGKARLIILHQDGFAGTDGADRLEGWLERLQTVNVAHLPVLLHGGLDSSLMVGLFRCGLFDALELPLTRSDWLNLLIRAEKKLVRRQQSRLILQDNARAQDLLRQMKASLGEVYERNAGDLLRAQETLEAVNRRLTHDMEELSLLYRFGRELSQARNWDEVLGRILAELGEFLDATGVTLVLKSAVGGAFQARRTWGWEDGSWDRVLMRLEEGLTAQVGSKLLDLGILGGTAGAGDIMADPDGRRIIALPLDHQGLRLGYLLLLFGTPERSDIARQRFMPFLQAVQVVMAEEVAGAQMLDRIRDIGLFNARVLETVSSGIWVFDEAGATVYCNQAGQEMLTGTAGPAGDPSAFLYRIGRGQLAEAVGPGADFPELITEGRLKVSGQQGLLMPFLREKADGVFRGEGEITSAGGEVVPVAVQSSLMQGQSRNQTWLVVVAEDQRERRQLEQERQRVDQLQGLVEMSATLAHEIRNPLMGLSAQAELLADQLDAGDDRIRYLEVITREVERINSTIDRMLNFTRPYQPELAVIDILEPVRDAVELCRSRAEEKRVELELEITAPRGSAAGREWVAEVDGAQLKQVLLNLLLNAIDASPAGERVVLAVAASEKLQLPAPTGQGRFLAPGIVISVRDHGPGFAPGDQARIFRPFFTTKSSGTGLGLSLCHKIVTAHGGDITAVRDGDITVFRVHLPRSAAGGPGLIRMEVAE